MTPSPTAEKPTEQGHEAEVSPELSGQRFDQALAKLFPDHSRSRLSQWIKEGRVLLDGRPARPRDAVPGGRRVRLTVVEEARSDVAPEDLPLDIMYEDAALIVVNKPAGLV